MVHSDKRPDLAGTARQNKERDDRIVFLGQVKLQQQGAHGDEAGNREDVDGRGGFLFDADLPLGEVVKYGHCLQCFSVKRPSSASSRPTVAMDTRAESSMRGSSEVPERYKTQEVI